MSAVCPALFALLVVASLAAAPGLGLLLLTRRRWDNGRRERRLAVSGIHGAVAGLGATCALGLLVLLGNMSNDRGVEGDWLVFLVAALLTLIPTIAAMTHGTIRVVGGKPSEASPPSPPSAPTTGAESGADLEAQRVEEHAVRRLRRALMWTLCAYIPAWGVPLLYVALTPVTTAGRPGLGNVVDLSALVALLINAVGLGHAIAAIRARRKLRKGHSLGQGPAWAAAMLALLGICGSFLLLFLGLVLEALGRGVGAVH
jgi:hypothetical protein